MKRFVPAVLAAFVLSGSASGQGAREYVADTAQAEVSVCIAFYSLADECSDAEARAPAEAARAKLDRVSDRIAAEAGLTASDLMLRLEFNKLAQRTLMGESCVGFGTLDARYRTQCQELLNSRD